MLLAHAVVIQDTSLPELSVSKCQVQIKRYMKYSQSPTHGFPMHSGHISVGSRTHRRKPNEQNVPQQVPQVFFFSARQDNIVEVHTRSQKHSLSTMQQFINNDADKSKKESKHSIQKQLRVKQGADRTSVVNPRTVQSREQARSYTEHQYHR